MARLALTGPEDPFSSSTFPVGYYVVFVENDMMYREESFC